MNDNYPPGVTDHTIDAPFNEKIEELVSNCCGATIIDDDIGLVAGDTSHCKECSQPCTILDLNSNEMIRSREEDWTENQSQNDS